MGKIILQTEMIEDVKSRIDLCEFVGNVVSLKRVGDNFKGLCPFHNEKTPSFSVSSSKQMYYCFGCGFGGDILDFIMRYEGITFPEALEKLATLAGIDLPQNTEYSQDRDRSRHFLTILDSAKSFFYRILLHDKVGEEVRLYLKNRQITDQTIQRFQLGYASSGCFSLLRMAQKSSVNVKDLLGVGLVRKRKLSGYSDFFKNRLIIPIHNSNGKVIAFGGRALRTENQPKYLNSSESSLFNKKRILFGLHHARKAMMAKRTVLLVEGYMDCIRMIQDGFDHVVATLGTSLTKEHAIILKRSVENVIIIYDNDASGQKAILRAIDILLEVGLFVQVFSLEKVKDPDEFLNVFGKEAFATALHSQTMDWFDFKYNLLKKEYAKQGNSSWIYIKISDHLFDSLLKIDNEIVRMKYLQKISSLMEIEEEVVRLEFLKKQKGMILKKSKMIGGKKAKIDLDIDLSEKNLCFLILKDSKYYPIVCQYEKKYSISWKSSLLTKIMEFLKSSNQTDYSSLVHSVKDSLLRNELVALLMEKIVLDDVADKVFHDSLKKVILRQLNSDVLLLGQKLSQRSMELNSLSNAVPSSIKSDQEKLQHLTQISYKINSEGLILWA